MPPCDLELVIAVDALFEQVFVGGENRPCIACVAVVNASGWSRLAASLALDADDPAALRRPLALKAALACIEAQTRTFSRNAMPRAVYLTLDPRTVENTRMVPTLKLKRNNLMARFTREIDALYPSGRSSA